MDTFDKMFCWTITVLVVGSGCYFLVTTRSIWQAVAVGAMCTACVWVTWTHVAESSRKIALARERDLFLEAAARYFRIAEDSEIGLTGVDLHERALVLIAWERYRQQVLDRSAR